MTKKNIVLTIILLAVFIGSSFLALSTAKKIISTKRHFSTNIPDFFMTSTVYTKYNIEGRIQNVITTDKTTHFNDNNVYLFEKPKIVMFTTGEEPWHISANQGKSEQGKTKIYLWDNVKIVRARGVNCLDFDIATTFLTIYPEAKYADTDRPVTIMQNGNITNAVGAEADFKTGIIKLISKIEALLNIK